MLDLNEYGAIPDPPDQYPPVRRGVRYWTLRLLYRFGAPLDVPFIGADPSCRRDSTTPLQAMIDQKHQFPSPPEGREDG